MNSQQNNSKLKAIVLVLALCLLASLAYIYKLTSEAKVTQNTITTITDEKGKVLDELAALKTTYDEAIAKNTSLSDELIAERDKVVRLIEEVKKSKGDVAALSGFKQKFTELQSKMKGLLMQVDQLKSENASLVSQRDSTITVLGETKKYNEVLIGQNEDLSKTIEKGAKLSVLNLKTAAYKLRSSGKQIETAKARKADILKISFTIAENAIAKSGDKTYYVQVIDSKNNVIGEKKTVTFDDKTLTYSFLSNVKYENKTVQVSQDLAGENFEKGTYFVNIFDKNELVSNSSFTLE
ncbi:hypothetical protein B0A58_03180 [Flavobacterium branchiophilum NBRC 15030 = ATCC 35035]|uniref:Chromosome partitioning protein ParA n=2 Tax=Flavobacterium branchiophilum TaxID=55197 RepID=G2Z7E7_FLABF|nr:hypothetical protein [Flavobacterium branchiophilum]OXA79719.1 hypothetical protein B0A58_03180 [Flavobacterium branchiophilum NBRC 15030 = ATCC 35035]PDS24792.1 hypothetical protein B0A77_07015 [Flavobacterium branchiophilum]TQM39647.1 hypothetical protein BC670_0465 [Flavobacterium branchiophilum]CCB69052.1 Probable transmembrane protein of unknown function [Flavobacterium branchiophilum FL-15]GEM56508.1 hypothetical protein FB1_27290 [Flavobacterium branchiophilum NBRC 15030 = ATCC 35035